MIKLLIIIPIALAALLYGGGYIAQFLRNHDVWQAAGGIFGTSPEFPDPGFFACIAAVSRSSIVVIPSRVTAKYSRKTD